MELCFLFFALPVLALIVFALPLRFKGTAAIALLLAGVAASALLICTTFGKYGAYEHTYSTGFLRPMLHIDSLSVFFVVLLNVAAITAFGYSLCYLKTFRRTKSSLSISLHCVAYLWLYCSMTGAVLFYDTTTFLLSWEMMTGATFILLIFEGENREKMKTAVSYLVQMHVCLFVLLAAFAIAGRDTGASGFHAVAEYFGTHDNVPLFLLFFAGFGLKAGFVPLHSWLPEVHPAAPGNVSGFMSGAVIKMGVYGLLRTVSVVRSDLFSIAIVVLIVSGVTCVYGIAKAAQQRDIKRLLAYSSIENIGIVGIGVGVGLLGCCWETDALIVGGFGGALLHIFNHSMFKTILFFSAATLCKSTHTQIIDRMGGAIRNMPQTAALFLFGAVAICALPPLSGFVSEFVMLSGMFASLGALDAGQLFIVLAGILALSIAGGIAIIAFTKAFGVAFLGDSRTTENRSAQENRRWSAPLLLPLTVVVLTAAFPALALTVVNQITGDIFATATIPSSLENSIIGVSLVFALLVGLTLVLWLCRQMVLRNRTTSKAPTWGCGYPYPTPKLQYTATSFSGIFSRLLNPAGNTRRRMKPINDDDLFPAARTFRTARATDKRYVDDFVEQLSRKLSKLAIFQTGKVQHYVLFALLFMSLILVLSYFVN
jgi:formate hydrogenlyase subunit 3/multisubunit Na+/H+ antiporter MnhD subunit